MCTWEKAAGQWICVLAVDHHLGGSQSGRAQQQLDEGRHHAGSGHRLAVLVSGRRDPAPTRGGSGRSGDGGWTETDAHPRRRAIEDFEHLSTTSSTGRVATSRQNVARCHDDRVVSRALRETPRAFAETSPIYRLPMWIVSSAHLSTRQQTTSVAGQDDCRNAYNKSSRV